MPRRYSWPLESPPAPETPADDSSGALFGTGGRPLRGLLTPFRRGANDFESGEGARLINSEIGQVLGTRCSSATTQGELPWRTDFGSLVQHARHKNNDLVLEALLNQWAVDAVARWLPNIRVTRTHLAPFKPASSPEGTGLGLRVFWELVSRGGQVMGSGDTSVGLVAIGRR
jgi:hypothetical protein